MSKLVLNGDTSGSVTLDAPAISGTTTLTLPTTSGTVLTTATGQTLTSPVIAGTPTGVGVLTSGTAVASTSGTSIDFTSIPNWVKRITVMFSGMSTNGTSLPQIQIGTSGGVQTSGYAGAVWQSNTTNTTFSAGFLLNCVGNAVYLIDGMATLTLLNSATGVWTYTVALGNESGAGIVGGGSKTLSGTLDRVRITTVNGTDAFDAGSINILYE